MNIVVLDGYTLNPGDLSWQGFERLGNFTVYDRTPEGLIEARIQGAQIVITNKVPLSREAILGAPALTYIGVLATGYNVVDTAAAAERGVVVTNIPTYGTASVAQFTFALLLALCHHVELHAQAVRAGAWSAQPDFCFRLTRLTELSGKTMGIVGAGRIGRAVAGIARALGMRVLAHDQFAAPCEGVTFVSLERLLAESDVVSLHCPLTPQNARMLDAAAFARMKRGALVLNTARGQLIDEAALRDALISGQVGGAGLDVASAEPVAPDSPLLSAPNCILTPHIAWAPLEARARLMEIAVHNLEAFLRGERVNAVG